MEHARNVLGRVDAGHAEYGEAGGAVITRLSCSLQGKEIEVSFTPGTLLHRAYGAATATEKTTCDYGLRPDLQELADTGGMRIAAVDGTGEVRAVERTDHPFFVGTLYQPQLSPPHPLFEPFASAMRTVR